MNWRGRVKYFLYDRIPGLAGAFLYYGIEVKFPPGSQIFKVACEQGIYESENLRVLMSGLAPESTAMDIGANIGLMSIPLLCAEPTLKVISVEPSPNTSNFLARTVAGSRFSDRWTNLPVAVGDRVGMTEFFCADPTEAVFDGMRDTNRGGATRRLEVKLTTVDKIWEDAKFPRVCVIKIDVEGGEMFVLKGAAKCIGTNRPLMLIEWSAANLKAHNIQFDEILRFAAGIDYGIYFVPSLVKAEDPAQLKVLMAFGESFVLLPL